MERTIDSLQRDFNVTDAEMSRLLQICGVPARPGGGLSQQETDRLYDQWLTRDNGHDNGLLQDSIESELDRLTEDAYWQISAVPSPVQPHQSVPQPQPKRGTKRKRLVLIDTSSLMETPASKLFLQSLIPALSGTGEKLIVPNAVLGELIKHVRDKSKPRRSKIAQEMYDLVLSYQQRGVIGIYGDKMDGNFPDNLFQQLVAMFARRYNVVVITQDNDLGQDLLLMGRMKSVGGRQISVRKLDRGGRLLNVPWKGTAI